MKKKIIALLLAFVMVLGMLPIGSMAAENSITVTVSAQQGYEFLLGKTEVTVTDGIAEEYGYENGTGVTGITSLDVLVAAHKQRYGDAFTKATAASYLTMSEMGNPVEIFDNNAEKGALSGFAINHQYPMDSSKNGYMVNSAPVANGDTLEFFYYSASYQDYLSWFVDGKGNPISEITVPANESFTAKLMGFEYMSGYSNPSPVSLYQADLGLNLCTVDANNNITATTSYLTSAEGAQLSFSEPGIYQVTALGICDEPGNPPVLMPWLTVTVRASLSEEEINQIITSDATSLTFSSIKGTNSAIDQITSNLKLPERGTSGKTSITWASSNPAVITNDGTVIRPLNDAADVALSLTATIAYGKTTQTKEFAVTVKKLPANTEVLSAVKAKLPTSLSPQEWNKAGTDKQDTNIITMVQTLVDKENPAVKVDRVCVPSQNQTQIATDGSILYNDQSAISWPVTFTLKLGESSLEYAPNVTVKKKQATKEDALRADWLTFDVIKEANSAANDVKTNLQLPKEDNKSYYTELVWTSSNPEIISIPSAATNGKFAASVTRPRAGESAASVTLTAKIQPGPYWSYGMAPIGPMPSPAYGTKTFELSVPAMSEAEQTAAQTMVDEAIKLYSLDGVTVRGSTLKADLMALSYSINDIPYNWNYVNKLPGFKEEYRAIHVQWSTTNPGFVNGKIDSGATVTRTSKDQTGKMTLTLSYNGAKAVKEWDSKILAFTEADAQTENAILQEVSNALTFDKIRKDNEQSSAVVSDLTLYEGAEKKSDGQIAFDKKKTYHKPGAQITWTSSNEQVIKVDYNGLKVTRPAKATEVTLTATLKSPMFPTAPGVKTLTKEIKVSVLPKQATANDVLLLKIAETYTAKDANWWTANGDWWHTIGLASYADYTGSSNLVSTGAKQAFVNKAISDVAGANGSSATDANKLANAISGLSALGYDATKLQTVNHTDVNALAKLKAVNIEEAKKGWYSTIAPYVLLALKQGDFNSKTQEEAHIAYLLEELSKVNWDWGADTPCMILQGLIPYYGRADVKTAVDAALVVLSNKQGQNGSFGNVNADAMATISLAMLGINPDTDPRFVKGQNSLLDGLLSYKNASGDGFGSNEMAKKQGFLALVSALQVMNTGKAYNPFDCTAIQKVAASATGNDTPTKPPEPSGNQDISVRFSLKTHNSTWISSTAVSLKNDAKVYHAFTKVLDGQGYTYKGAENSYVTSITNPQNTTLAEFSHGKNSGWLYKVNGKLPDVGICEYPLKSGDDILFYYTEDWTKDEAAGSIGGGGSIPKPEEKPVDKPVLDGSGGISMGVTTEAKTDINGNATATVDKEAVEKAISEVVKAAEGNGIRKKEVNLTIRVDKNAKKVETTIPKDTLKKLNEKVDIVKLSTPGAELSLDEKVLETIAKEAGDDVKIAIATVDISKNDKLSEEAKKRIGNKPVYDFSISSGSKRIAQFAGEITVKLPYTPEQGEDVRKLVVYYIDAEGKLAEMVGARYDAKNKSIVFTTNHFSTFAVGYDESLAVFSDVTADDWFFGAVRYVVSKKLFTGSSEESFSPNASMTRAMFFTVLHRLSGDTKFTGGEHWYSDGMAWAKEKGISDGENPNGEITREQLVTMLWRYQNAPVLAEDKELSTFSDGKEVSTWAVQAMQWAHAKDLIHGRTANTLMPKGNATRAEVATMMMRFLEQAK